MTAKHTAIVVVVMFASLSLALVAVFRSGGWRGLLPRGEIAEVPEESADEQLVAKPKPRPVPRGVTVPPSDGSHDVLPADPDTDLAFELLTEGIEVDQ